METSIRRTNLSALLRYVVYFLAGALLIVWLIKTPGGLLGKADAIAYAVCHRIASRSFQVDGRQLALCARCTGMFMGALLGITFQGFFGRRGGMPGLLAAVVFILFAGAFAFDGVNSYLHLFPGAPGLYIPNNTLRLLTGTGMGLAISSVIVPAFNQTIWADWTTSRVFSSWKPLAGVIGLGALLDLLILTGSPIVLYPVYLLSAAAVLVLLALIYTMVWVMLFRVENHYQTYHQLAFSLLGGLTTALLQIAVIDLARFWLTGTWQGFNL